MAYARRFQVELLPDLAWGELRRRVIHAEELGFDIATTADQFVDWKNPSSPWFDVWATLAALEQPAAAGRRSPASALDWPGWIRTTTAGSKDRCPAIRRRAKLEEIVPLSLLRDQPLDSLKGPGHRAKCG